MKKLVLVALGAAFSLGLAFGADMDMKKDGMMKDKKSMPMEDKKDMM